MSAFKYFYMIETYGLRMTIEQTAHALGLATNTLYNKIAAGTLKVPSYLDDGKRWFDPLDVSAYLDAMRASSRVSDSYSVSGAAMICVPKPKKRAVSPARLQTSD